jgi:hypothetical protein
MNGFNFFFQKIENSFEKVAFLLVRFLWPRKENEQYQWQSAEYKVIKKNISEKT